MQLANIPVKFPIPWGNAAGGAYIRQVPTASQIGIQSGAASLTDGFPPLCFTPLGAGGIPPFGQDTNGIFNQVTAWCRWISAGGAIPFYDGAFSAAIGGYPQGAMLQNATVPGSFWISLVDNNVSDPDTGGANWLAFPGNTLKNPVATQTSSATFNFSADTQYALALKRSASLAPMAVNLAVTGTLGNGQVFEIWDISGTAGTCDLYPVTVSPPGGHNIIGESTYICQVANGVWQFKYFGGNNWGVKVP